MIWRPTVHVIGHWSNHGWKGGRGRDCQRDPQILMISPDLVEREWKELLFGFLQPALNDRQAFGCDRYRSIGLLQLLNQQLDEIILELLGRQRGERKALA